MSNNFKKEKRAKTPPVSAQFKTIAGLFGIKNRIGFPEPEIESAEQEIGKLPQLLREYYLELGAHEELNSTQDYLITPADLPSRKQGEYLVFYSENQDVYLWAVSPADADCADPSIYTGEPIMMDGKDETTWVKEDFTLSEFLNAQAYMQAVFSFEYSSEEFSSITEKDVDYIRTNFKNKGLAISLWSGVEFFGNYDDSVVMLMKNGETFDLLYSSRNEAHFNQMDAVLANVGEVL